MIYQLIQQLINQAIATQLIEREDEIYARNQILSLLRLTEFKEVDAAGESNFDIPDLLDLIVDYACNQGIIEELFDEKEIFSSKIMNCFIARPSAVNQLFYGKYKQDPKAATQYFYELSKNSNYIQMKRIRNNIEYKTTTEYGELDITINLSKPEKDPKSIELERSVKQMDYPKCLLCVENEGYAGRIGHPARSNHRMIRVNLLENTWYLQYSPYVYYNEHCIVLAEKHTDMVISPTTFLRLLSFVEQFPHYFVGSNADLPIVGGSILSHDHYQGGNYQFAMAKAGDDWAFKMAGYPEVECAVVKWPMSVIRLRSDQISTLVEAGSHILDKWKKYSDEDLGIEARTGVTPHNTITPIARKNGNVFELDLVLRNNRKSDEHPLGIFHPHADVHHIKKENIGLIEVMGLAVLPARLKGELGEVENYILGQSSAVAEYHLDWAEALKARYQAIANEANVDGLVREEVGKKFLRCLEDAGVFKRNEVGAAGFQRFISTL
ncbi:UDP-glucose--hexose-1-phosphate uridylyltransferase [Bacillus sp. ISL-40]|uniref:UDP-glucose--hexose-1-phosphate uridylyltransferase n=1 Tax=unclassified Bacillus (in: firmicutes) TaxID=185979 RepID=UPI001BEBFC5B|nr:MULTISPECIES: UDP-glucose--hexose-1-phosphate uridylyltransferase [unclassified Bacillus (in: firmicutes)]MBT2699590.1 UDP-glucose--hexose-1-phosphate uridylyltransferase [Bacillus sp. ISL-40]MBT2724142.1 UDP-glucose--hexose-1-phosphate uridylyltransferase [Bacillus sp. ISL-46]MBT2741128.1 UDP-glucose--hexose-1-phosphate uridylyltransferase [Bacillus sp. ISL-77]